MWPRAAEGTRRTAALAAVLLLVVARAYAQGAGDQGAADRGLVGVHIATAADTLPDIAIANDLGFVELIAANRRVDPWLPTAGTRIVLPMEHLLPDAPHRGIVINLPDQRLYYFPPKGPMRSFPIGVAAEGVTFRTGVTRIVAKREHPTWYPPPSIRAEDPGAPLSVPPGPDNPLGDFALYTAWTDIVIHGTNRIYGIGRRVSHGCFRLYPNDIKELFRLVPIGTPVTVVDQPAKAGWIDGRFYLEVHPTLDQADDLVDHGSFTPEPVAGLERLVFDAAEPHSQEIDWQAVERVARERTGIPTPVLK